MTEKRYIIELTEDQVEKLLMMLVAALTEAESAEVLNGMARINNEIQTQVGISEETAESNPFREAAAAFAFRFAKRGCDLGVFSKQDVVDIVERVKEERCERAAN